MTEAAAAPDTNRLRTVVEKGMERLMVPGVVVGIWHGGRETILAFGVTNLECPLPVTTDTLFQVGSNTKTVTGTAVVRLVEKGEIDLDAPVRTYLPGFRVADEDASRRVTVRHLMTHTAGWEGDVWADTGRGDDALARMVDQMVDRPQLTPIGEIWAYNNAAFYALGRIIEVVSGRTYEDAARELVLAPLGMVHSFFLPEDVMTYRFATGHHLEGDSIVVQRPWQWPRSGGPVGRLISTAADMLRYARFTMGDGSAEDGARILSPESMKLMQTPVCRASGRRFIGLTWFLRDIQGVRAVEHGGSTAGQISAFLMAPERDFAVVSLTNADNGGQLNTEIVECVLEEYLGLVEPKPKPLVLAAGHLASFAGRYHGAYAYLDLRLEDGALVAYQTPTKALLGRMAPTPPPARVAVIGNDVLQVMDGPGAGVQAEIIRDVSGAIAWLRLGSRLWRRDMPI